MYYFASDIHLGAGGPAAARAVEKRFVAWLDEVSRDADAVFILGDLFDFWFEYKRVVPKGFVRVLGKLCELTDRGIRVVFMTVITTCGFVTISKRSAEWRSILRPGSWSLPANGFSWRTATI